MADDDDERALLPHSTQLNEVVVVFVLDVEVEVGVSSSSVLDVGLLVRPGVVGVVGAGVVDAKKQYNSINLY